MAVSLKLLAPVQNFDVSLVKNSTKFLSLVNDLLNFQYARFLKLPLKNRI